MNHLEREELVSYRINKAKETYSEVPLHIQNQLWNTCINRLYYASYYAVAALLIKNEISTQTHAGARQMFGLNFIKTGKLSKEIGKTYSDVFDKRQTGDYEDFIDYEKQDVMELMEPVSNVISEIEKLL